MAVRSSYEERQPIGHNTTRPAVAQSGPEVIPLQAGAGGYVVAPETPPLRAAIVEGHVTVADASEVVPSLAGYPVPPRGTVEQAFSCGAVAFRISALADPDNIIGESLAGLQLDIASILVGLSYMEIHNMLINYNRVSMTRLPDNMCTVSCDVHDSFVFGCLY